MRKRDQLLNALMAFPTVTQAAQAAGVSRTRAYELMAEPEFRDELNRAKRTTLEASTRYMQTAVSECVETLMGIVRDESNAPQVRINAAQVVLSNARAFTEAVDLVPRIEALEELAKADAGGGGGHGPQIARSAA